MRLAFVAVAALASLSGCYRHHTRSLEAGPDAGLDAARPRDAELPRDARVDAPDVPPTCATGPHDIVRQRVSFAATPPRCPWGMGDNLPADQARATARVEQREPLREHAGERLCSLRIDFGASGTSFRYDDNFFFLFGEVVLAASDRHLVERLPRDGDLRIWDWRAIAGREMAVADNEPYCLGAAEGRARCELPLTEELGIARLDFDPDLVAELVARGAVSMGFVTVGDNDPSSDCAHDAFAFDFVGTYLIP